MKLDEWVKSTFKSVKKQNYISSESSVDLTNRLRSSSLTLHEQNLQTKQKSKDIDIRLDKYIKIKTQFLIKQFEAFLSDVLEVQKKRPIVRSTAQSFHTSKNKWFPIINKIIKKLQNDDLMSIEVSELKSFKKMLPYSKYLLLLQKYYDLENSECL